MNESLSENSYLNLEQISIPLNEDDELAKYNSSQTINLHGVNIPINYEFPGLELEAKDFITEEKKITKENTINFENGLDMFDKKLVFKTTICSRGRKGKNYNDKSQKKVHGKLEKDNILRKVNVFFLSFIIKFSNEIVGFFKFKKKFIPLSYSFKQKITKEWREYLKGLTLGELLCNNISEKWKKHKYNENKAFYEKVKKNENIRKIFSENYMTIFNLFIKNQRNIKIGNNDYYLSPSVKMFDDFLLKIEKKYKNDSSLYIERIKEVIKDY
jgi:predicted Zn-dependent protease